MQPWKLKLPAQHVPHDFFALSSASTRNFNHNHWFANGPCIENRHVCVHMFELSIVAGASGSDAGALKNHPAFFFAGSSVGIIRTLAAVWVRNPTMTLNLGRRLCNWNACARTCNRPCIASKRSAAWIIVRSLVTITTPGFQTFHHFEIFFSTQCRLYYFKAGFETVTEYRLPVSNGRCRTCKGNRMYDLNYVSLLSIICQLFQFAIDFNDASNQAAIWF